MKLLPAAAAWITAFMLIMSSAYGETMVVDEGAGTNESLPGENVGPDSDGTGNAQFSNVQGMADSHVAPRPNVQDTIGYFDIVEDENGCSQKIIKLNPLIHKPKYTVAVLATEGDQLAKNMYNYTFEKYLTATAGKKFDPPIEFEMIPVSLDSVLTLAETESLDFFFGSSALASCMMTEFQAQALATVVNRRWCRGYLYELDVAGGVMFTLADRDDIQRIDDFNDKIIAASALTTMEGGQSQIYEMFQRGLSYVADPAQVVFTGSQKKVVEGVLTKAFDIGFVGTDELEQFIDSFKIINEQNHVLEDGLLFPFLSSTELHPEWPVAAMEHVAPDVSREVQEALLNIQDHYSSIEYGENIRCETTPQIAQLAKDSSYFGMLAGFRTSRSYFQVRSRQEAAGFLLRDGADDLRCIRGETLYDDISCPAGYYKMSKTEFENSCQLAGLPCDEGFECYCQPCVRAYEVDVFEKEDLNVTELAALEAGGIVNKNIGCAKMDMCGETEQRQPITFTLVDFRKRENPNIKVTVHLNEDTFIADVFEDDILPWTYSFTWSWHLEGVAIMEISFDGQQIPQSPIRAQIMERNCEKEFGASRSPTVDGLCICKSGSFDVDGACIESTVIAICSSIAGAMLVSIALWYYVTYTNRKNDELWQVDTLELQFDDPVEVIGQGSFGVVLLAEYRGTKVAIKRACRAGDLKGGSKSKSRSSKKSRSKSKQSTSKESKDDLEGNSNNPDQDHVLSPGSDDGCVSTDDEGPSCESGDIEAGCVSYTGNMSRNRSGNDYSLAFLGQTFGKENRWRLWPWGDNNQDYQARFKETILGSSAGSMSTSKTFAARMCSWFDEAAIRQKEFVQEMRVLSRLRHPNITSIIGAVLSRNHDPMLVMEYMEYGSLHDLLGNETMVLTGEIIMQVFRDVAQGLRYLHSSKPPLLHGDLKARNILVDTRFRAKLCDFGLADKSTKSITGTPYWLAPEYLKGHASYNPACDMYSMGIVFYEVFARESPYNGEPFKEVLRKVCDRRINKRPGIPKHTPPKMAELMKKLWSPDPISRPTAAALDSALMDMNNSDAEPTTELKEGEDAKRTTVDMLYEIFPKHIADALKAGQKVSPENHENVTVVFSDIVSFTTISQTSTPLKVSTMLDRLYLAFDRIARKHSVFKVETIGDAYMGVTNLLNNQDNTHVKQVAEFAIDMINEASKILIDDEDPSKGFINIRVGFHSGPVVSNVIGSLNPRYGLFGDTVNTASRMESNSKANRILCSEKSFRLLKEQAPDIMTKKRGTINVKGKGDMTVFWVGNDKITAKSKKEVVHVADNKHVVFAPDISESGRSLEECPLTPTKEIVSKETVERADEPGGGSLPSIPTFSITAKQ